MNKRMLVAARIFMLLVMVTSFAFVAAPVAANDEGPQVKVIATGLDNPRGMTFGPDGALYVAEAGKGGTDCVIMTPPDAEEPSEVCFGFTGAITRIKAGKQVRIFKNLLSLADPTGEAATGVHDVAFTTKGLRVTVGLGANPEEVRPLIPEPYKYFGMMGQLLWGGKLMKSVVDIAGYEVANNPEPTAVDSNPYAVINDGKYGIVTDAGGNSLLRVDAWGNIETLAIFPPQIVDVPPGLPFPLPPQMPMEAVPNSLVKGPDGAYYVGQLGGFPFVAGKSSVFRVVPGQPVEVYATGLTSTIDIAFDKWGNLYVLEIAANGLLNCELMGDCAGALIRVKPDGTQEMVPVEGLVAPTGMAIRGDYIYVANHGIFPGEGEILRIKP